jgi:hypothetical protein
VSVATIIKRRNPPSSVTLEQLLARDAGLIHTQAVAASTMVERILSAPSLDGARDDLEALAVAVATIAALTAR